MLHSQRDWYLQAIGCPENLAYKLAHCTWTGCTAFELEDYIFANDATCADGAQEYAILKPSHDGSSLVQIESITFSWCSEERALEMIREIIAGTFNLQSYGTVDRGRFSTPSEHGTCYLCA
jgi:hypothetical protein